MRVSADNGSSVASTSSKTQQSSHTQRPSLGGTCATTLPGTTAFSSSSAPLLVPLRMPSRGRLSTFPLILPSLSKLQTNLRNSYTQSAIYIAPQNPSPWNYLRGIFAQTGTPLFTLLTFCLTFAPISKPPTTTELDGSSTTAGAGEITSSHALDLLAEIYAEKAKFEGMGGAAGGEAKEESKLQAVKALELLAERYDPLRANYWDWRKREVLAV